MKIITKASDWAETKNPFVDQLVCPCCDKPGAVLEPRFVLTDGPQSHINLSNIKGKLLTTKGKCPHCQSSFLWRMMISLAGAFSWTDILVPAKTYNALLASHSTDQLPCLCETCQKEKGLKPDHDQSTGATATVPKVHPHSHSVPTAKDLADSMLKAGAVDQVLEEQSVADIVGAVASNGRLMTDEQVRIAAEAMGYTEAMAKANLTQEQIEGIWKTVTDFVEGYVRIKFATFQPQVTDDHDLPPHFPAIMPTVIYANFKAQKECVHMCQFLISKCAPIDVALGRLDLPATVIYTHMCAMCKLSDCQFHPSKREET